LSDPSATVVVVEHRDRGARFGVEHREAALSAQGLSAQVTSTARERRVVVADAGETTDDLIRDMIEMLTWMGARRYGRSGARNRAARAVTATQLQTTDQAVEAA
jgi:putative resolvase